APIAYQVLGAGPVDLVYLPPWGNLVWNWQRPPHARFLRRLASFSRLIVIDQRGFGCSTGTGPAGSLETAVDDLFAVIEQLRVHRPRSSGRVAVSSLSWPPPHIRSGRPRREGRRHVLTRAGRRLRVVQDEPGRRARRSRLALQHEPPHLHDSRPRGGWDVDRRRLRGGLRRIRRRLRRAGGRPDGLIVSDFHDARGGIERRHGAAGRLVDVNPRWLRLLVLVVGAGTVEPPVPEDDPICVEHETFEVGDSPSAIARELPGDALRDE